jgi:hypothetical protein
MVVYHHLPGRAEENYEEPQSQYSVAGRMEGWTGSSGFFSICSLLVRHTDVDLGTHRAISPSRPVQVAT